jgi:ATP-dependent Clp protease ATP-binding subunit ClpA
MAEPSVYESFLDDARRVMELATKEAQRFQHEYIGTEHILLAILKLPDSAAGRIIRDFQLDCDRLRRYVEQFLVTGPGSARAGELVETPRAKSALAYALLTAGELGHDRIGSDYILLGLFHEEDSVAGSVLRYTNLRFDDVRDRVHGKPGTQPRPPAEPAALAHLPVELQNHIRRLDSQIEHFVKAKEKAVDDSDFEKAATLRDRADSLRKQRQALLSQADERH